MRKRMVVAGMVGSLCLLATLLFGADLTRSNSSARAETDPLRKQVKELEARVKALEGTVRQLQAMLGPGVTPLDAGAGTSPPTFRRVPRAPLRQGEIWREGECNGWPYYLIPCGAVEAGTVR
jgi:outer membrane murein-binding lipoprotein Lpp